MSAGVSLEHVSKMYQAPRHEVGLWGAAAGLARRLRGRDRAPKTEPRWALQDVSFAVEPGEILGLIGRNGAGKSTLLKLVAGITQPTKGRVAVAGRVGSLLELGAGFHPELSGRENVFLNGQILGLSRRQIKERYDAIVDFAELAEFMDTPVKRYSSGMYARLGFAVAVHMDPDILLVDEVLSVGDESFRRKSQERMLTLVKSGKAVILVSHNLLVIEHLCSRAVWLDRGRIRQTGRGRDVVQSYLDEQEAAFLGEATVSAQGRGVNVEQVTLRNGAAEPTTEFRMGEDIEVSVQYYIADELPRARFVLGVVGASGPLFAANMLVDGACVPGQAGRQTVSCTFRNVPLMPGAYQVYGEVWGEDGFDPVVIWSEWARFRINDVSAQLLCVGENPSLYHVRADAPIAVPYDWHINRRRDADD
jgi:lipopolysaccharide transport system ATP-binding protein